AFGLNTPQIRRIARTIGRDQALAEQLWQTGIHDARILAGLVADPATISRSTMDRWAADFDSLGHLRLLQLHTLRRHTFRTRDAALCRAAIQCAERIRQQGTKPARWIAADALRELRAVQNRRL